MPDPIVPVALERRPHSSDGPGRDLPAAQPQPSALRPVSARRRRVLIIVENLPCPFDRRVWQEARTLSEAGYLVSIICPKGKGFEKSYEELEGIAIHRHRLPIEASGALGYAREQLWAPAAHFSLSQRVLLGRGFDAIHAGNPPDTIFLIVGFYQLFGKQFLFDHRDINPELYEAKRGRRNFFHRLLCLLERCTF